jgi:hypothetical protein
VRAEVGGKESIAEYWKLRYWLACISIFLDEKKR